MRRKVVLYNPEAVFYTMPLSLLAVGSCLDRRRYEVCVVDGRLERDPLAALLAAAGDALCVGVTVLTGAPIRDALRVTRALKARRRDLPVIWGGWHPSLFPRETLEQAGIDGVVVGQGEETFTEILERLSAGAGLEGVAGCLAAGSTPAPPRPLQDINRFPPHDYTLIPVERYFQLKGQRQLDYISSQGCRFRCTFCADPFVYKRGWFGLEPERVAGELDALWRRYRVEDVGFQDETFFTSPRRVATLAEAFRLRQARFTWTATMRADQGHRLDEALLADCRRAGLRRVMIGVESGSQEMLDWMKKDITVAQVLESAEKCLRQGIGAIFNIIVGFPGEPPESVQASLDMAKRLRAMSPAFEVAIFYYKPYPGNPIADKLLADGHAFPRMLEEWAEFDYVGSSGPWVSREKQARIERFKFYQRVAWSRPQLARLPLQAVARWRCKRDAYAFPVEKLVVEWLRPPVRLS
ncbi:MAG: B12-binding domain-containing radical SAM protein [Gemmatimonadetes bacterium]|nr:B12-binding domain-containing radical SAM protein [Gemmatimonadota bacterium]